MARQLTLRHGEEGFTVTVEKPGVVRVGDTPLSVEAAADGSVRFLDGSAPPAWVAAAGDTRWVFLDGRVYEFEIERGHRRRRRGGSHHGSLTAPMPATVRKINVAVGDRVRRGETLLVLEAMKMELPVKAGADGRVEAINCREGELVQPGAALVDLEEDD